MFKLLLHVLLVLKLASANSISNMNGDYLLTKTPNGGPTSKFPIQYADYPGGAEYFDVYSDIINSTYAEVIWKTLDPVSLPAEIVSRFANKTIAIVGFEWDQVRTLPSGEEVSVPMSVAYNHHWSTTMLGSDSRAIKVPSSDPRVLAASKKMSHGIQVQEDGLVWITEDLNPMSKIPNHVVFGDQNGGEARKSFKGNFFKLFLMY